MIIFLKDYIKDKLHRHGKLAPTMDICRKHENINSSILILLNYNKIVDDNDAPNFYDKNDPFIDDNDLEVTLLNLNDVKSDVSEDEFMKLKLKKGKYTQKEIIKNLERIRKINKSKDKTNIISSAGKLSGKNGAVLEVNNDEEEKYNEKANGDGISNNENTSEEDISLYFKELEELTQEYSTTHDIVKLSEPRDKINLIKKYILVGKKIKGNTKTFHTFMKKISSIIYETIEDTQVNLLINQILYHFIIIDRIYLSQSMYEVKRIRLTQIYLSKFKRYLFTFHLNWR